jgi:hypothetical protein
LRAVLVVPPLLVVLVGREAQLEQVAQHMPVDLLVQTELLLELVVESLKIIHTQQEQ